MTFARDRKQTEEYRRVFDHAAQDDDPYQESYDDQDYEDEYTYDEDDMTYDDYMDFMTEEERRRDKWRVFSGLADFIGVIVGAVTVLLLIALLVSLMNWVQADISQSFTLWQTKM